MSRRSVFAYFFLLPAIFAGIPAFFWHPLPRGMSLYEGVRMAYLAIGAAVFAATFSGEIVRTLRVPLCRMLGLSPMSPAARFGIWAVAGFFVASMAVNGTDAISDLLAGRTYSVVALASVAAIFVSLASVPEAVRVTAIRAAVVGFLSVNLPYSAIQFLGADPVTPLLSLPDWGVGRSFGTLWNPNALAFFAALCLPAAFSYFGVWTRWAIILASLAIIALSGSLSGWAVALAYLGYRGYRTFSWSIGAKRVLRSLAAIPVLSLTMVPWAFPQKTLSLETRAVIVSDVATHLFESPKRFFFGEGSGAVGRWFSSERGDCVSKYVNPVAPIEKAHFAFLDLAAVFGIPFALAVFVAMGFAAWKNPEPSAREGLGIFWFLGCLHTPGVAEWTLATLLIIPVRPKGRGVKILNAK